MIDYEVKNLGEGWGLNIKEQWLCDKVNDEFKTKFKKDVMEIVFDDKIINYLDSRISSWKLTRNYIYNGK